MKTHAEVSNEEIRKISHEVWTSYTLEDEEHATEVEVDAIYWWEAGEEETRDYPGSRGQLTFRDVIVTEFKNDRYHFTRDQRPKFFKQLDVIVRKIIDTPAYFEQAADHGRSTITPPRP